MLTLIQVGQTRLELLEPLSGDSPVGRFIEQSGEGLHHLALNVSEISDKLRGLETLGFQLVDKDVTVLQLCNEGIDCVLTMYGTVGFEAAVLGHLVVNASTSNQHVAYNFNLHPSTVEEYEKLLLDLPNIVWNIDRNEIYEFYAMSKLYPPRRSWTHNDIDGFIESLGGWGHPTDKNSGCVKHHGPISYKKFLDEFCLEKHHKRLNLVANYLCTGDYVMRWDKDFNLLRDGSQLSENSN